MHHVWGLPVALDLFFAGLGAGLFLVAVMADLFGGERYRGVRRVGGVLAPWPVLLGVLLLVVDLGNPQRFWEFVLRAGPGFLIFRPSSVMSWGTWLLVIFSIVSLAYCALSLVRWPFEGDEKVRRAIGVVGLPFGLLVTIYTGVLIAGTAIPLWDTPMLPVLFVCSALLAGLAAAMMVLGLRPSLGLSATNESVMNSLAKAQSVLSVVVLALALVYVGVVAGRDGGAAHAASALWWVFVVVLGLVVPLVFGLVRSKVKVALATPAVAGLAVLGAFFLRYTILMNGQV
jgi:polysulfide reductase chain C